jgi:hypothetical protein
VQNLVNMSTTNTSAAAPRRLRFELLTKLNGGDNAKTVSTYTRNGSLKTAIAQLKLERGNKFASLVSVFDDEWDGASAYLVQQASTPQQITNKSTSTIVQTIAEMLRSVVDKHKAKYSQEVKNDSVRLQHLKAVAGMLVKAAYELSTGCEGDFAPALFSASTRELATAQKKHLSEVDNVSETPEDRCKAKDAEIAALKQQLHDSAINYSKMCKEYQEKYSKLHKEMRMSTEEQLRQELGSAQTMISILQNDNAHLTRCMNLYKKRSENNELEVRKAKTKLDGMDELSNRLLRAELGQKEASSACEW